MNEAVTISLNDAVYSIDQISALMYTRHISLRKMSKMLGIDSSRLHAMMKYKDEEHNKLLRIACTWVLQHIDASLTGEQVLVKEYFPSTIVYNEKPLEVTL